MVLSFLLQPRGYYFSDLQIFAVRKNMYGFEVLLTQNMNIILFMFWALSLLKAAVVAWEFCQIN